MLGEFGSSLSISFASFFFSFKRAQVISIVIVSNLCRPFFGFFIKKNAWIFSCTVPMLILILLILALYYKSKIFSSIIKTISINMINLKFFERISKNSMVQIDRFSRFTVINCFTYITSMFISAFYKIPFSFIDIYKMGITIV